MFGGTALLPQFSPSHGPSKGAKHAVVPTWTSMLSWEEEEGWSALTEVNSLLRAAAVIES